MHLVLAFTAALAAASPDPTPAPPKTTAVLAREARAAYDAGDKAGFLRITEEIAGRRPGDVYVLYNLACGQALNGQTDAAVRTLQQIAELQTVADLDADTDFESIRQTDGYKKARDRMAALRAQHVSSGAVVAFTIHEKGLVPEGVAYDPATKSFFVSSIRKRKVVRVDASGQVTDFVKPAQGGLRSAAGIAADPKRRSLWVASEAMPHMEGFRKGDPPASALFEFDLDTGMLRRELRPPASDPPAAFDDLAVAADGRVYVNDGRNPRIWTLAPGARALELFVESDAFRGTQGLASTPDGKSLYVSDYSRLFRVDVASKRVTPLAVPPDAALNGVDGLVYAGGSLYGIQNGVEPHRVTRLELGGDGVTIIGAKILVMNHPDFDEPTLGVAADGALYFTANSQGGKFQDEKKPITPDAMRDAVILKLPLAPPAAR
jgi:sugar lactone lactonase YvrE